MTKEELFLYFTSRPNPDKNGQMKREKNFKKKFPEIYNEFLNFEFYDDLKNEPFVQRLWHFLQNDNGQLGHCVECNRRTSFISFSDGYLKFCSSKCSSTNEDALAKRKISCIEKHGGMGYASEKTSKKCKATMKSKYGVEYTAQSKELLEKIKSSTIKNNDGIGFSSSKIAKSFNETMEKRYGVKWTAQSRQLVEKKRQEKIDNSENFVNITDEEFVLRCTDKCCNLCKEKQFTINKSTYATRISRNNELCTIKNPISKHVSDTEIHLREYINDIYDGQTIYNDRKTLDGLEIDILLPDLKLGFEFNGDFWHLNPEIYDNTKTLFGKTQEELQSKDKNKQTLAKEKGIELLLVWENDWNNNSEKTKELIKNTIINKLKLSENLDINK